MRTYTISPVSSASSAESTFPSPISSRSVSPSLSHPQYLSERSDVQATPRPGAIYQHIHSNTARLPAPPSPTVGLNARPRRGTFHYANQPQHWDHLMEPGGGLTAGPANGVSSSPDSRLRSEPGGAPPSAAMSPNAAAVLEHPRYIYQHPSANHGTNRPSLFAHHTTSGVGRAGRSRPPIPPYPYTPKRKYQHQFVHVSASKITSPLAKVRTSQACEVCRKRKVKCSGDRPECARCVERGFVCEYAIINETSRVHARRLRMEAKLATSMAPSMGVSSVERARMERRHLGQGDHEYMGPEMELPQSSVSVHHQMEMARPALVKYATEDGRMYITDVGTFMQQAESGPNNMDVDMDISRLQNVPRYHASPSGVAMSRSGSGVGSSSGARMNPRALSPPLIESEPRLNQRLQRPQSGPEIGHHLYRDHTEEPDGVSVESGEETELVIVEVPRRSRRPHSLLELLNPVSVHPLSIYNAGKNAGVPPSTLDPNLSSSQGYAGSSSGSSTPPRAPSLRTPVTWSSTPPKSPPASATITMTRNFSSTSAHSARTPDSERSQSSIGVGVGVEGTPASAAQVADDIGVLARTASPSVSELDVTDMADDMELSAGWIETIRCLSQTGSANGEWTSDEAAGDIGIARGKLFESDSTASLASANNLPGKFGSTFPSSADLSMYRTASNASVESSTDPAGVGSPTQEPKADATGSQGDPLNGSGSGSTAGLSLRDSDDVLYVLVPVSRSSSASSPEVEVTKELREMFNRMLRSSSSEEGSQHPGPIASRSGADASAGSTTLTTSRIPRRVALPQRSRTGAPSETAASGAVSVPPLSKTVSAPAAYPPPEISPSPHSEPLSRTSSTSSSDSLFSADQWETYEISMIPVESSLLDEEFSFDEYLLCDDDENGPIVISNAVAPIDPPETASSAPGSAVPQASNSPLSSDNDSYRESEAAKSAALINDLLRTPNSDLDTLVGQILDTSNDALVRQCAVEVGSMMASKSMGDVVMSSPVMA